MSDTGHDNWNGYTVGESEGKWSRVNSALMKYERASPQTYGPPTSQAYRDGWERIFGKKTESAEREEPCENCGEEWMPGHSFKCKYPPSEGSPKIIRRQP